MWPRLHGGFSIYSYVTDRTIHREHISRVGMCEPYRVRLGRYTMGNVNLLQAATQVVFVLLFVVTAANFAHHRDRAHLEVTALLGSLGIPIALQFFAGATGIYTAWIGVAATLAIVAQPALLLQLVRQFRPVPVL